MLLSHHLVIDHTTLELIIAEVRAHLAGNADQLPKPVPFRNFVAEAKLGVSQEEHETFFREMLGDIDEPTAPFGLLDVRGDGSGIAEAQLPLESDLAERLRAQIRRLGVAGASLFHLAWTLVLARTSGRDDVVFGTVLFGRMHGGANVDRAFGLFINTLPLRLTLNATPVAQALRDTHDRMAQLLRHEHASLALAQRCSAMPPNIPLFSTLLNYRYTQAAAEISANGGLLLPGVQLLHAEERSNYPFALSVDDGGVGFNLTAQVSDQLDPARICRYMHTAVEQLVWALEEAPETPVRSLYILSAAERDQLLHGWNPVPRVFPALTLPGCGGCHVWGLQPHLCAVEQPRQPAGASSDRAGRRPRKHSRAICRALFGDGGRAHRRPQGRRCLPAARSRLSRGAP
jgi:hypothetical protein